MLRKAALSGFPPSPLLAIGTRMVWAASCSLCIGALLVVAGAGNQHQTSSTSGRRRMGPENALCALAPAPHLSLAREGPARGHLRKDTTLASVSCIRESGTLLGKPSSAPMSVCSGKQRLPVYPLALCSPMVRGVSGLQHAPCAPVVCWWWPELETHSKRALLRGEGGWG